MKAPFPRLVPLLRSAVCLSKLVRLVRFAPDSTNKARARGRRAEDPETTFISSAGAEFR